MVVESYRSIVEMVDDPLQTPGQQLSAIPWGDRKALAADYLSHFPSSHTEGAPLMVPGYMPRPIFAAVTARPRAGKPGAIAMVDHRSARLVQALGRSHGRAHSTQRPHSTTNAIHYFLEPDPLSSARNAPFGASRDLSSVARAILGDLKKCGKSEKILLDKFLTGRHLTGIKESARTHLSADPPLSSFLTSDLHRFF
jgi:hypothetical protein